jgi:hypothetical protein
MPEAILRPLRALVATTFIAMSLPAFAASQRTFVASYGQDANAAAYGCSLAHPCRTFAGALPQVNAGGEVVVLDSAGYGAFTVDKAVSVIAPPAVQASITVAAGNGVTVAAGATDAVRLVGLTIVGQGGTRGVTFQSGGSLTIERCAIGGMSSAGIDILGGGVVRVVDSTLENNPDKSVKANVAAIRTEVEVLRTRISGSAYGVVFNAPGSLTIDESSLTSSGSFGYGVLVQATSDHAPISSHVSRTLIKGWFKGVVSYQSVAYSSVSVTESELVANHLAISAESGATIALDRTRVVHNDTGVDTYSGGVVYTSGTNYFAYNAADLTFGVTLAGPGGYR